VIRIVGVQKNASPSEEFVLLQNQGALRLNLRGHLILSECAIDGSLCNTAHAFSDDVLVPAGMYVCLYSGFGESRWVKTKDGALVYYAFMGRDRAVWRDTIGPLHVLCTQHSYSERREMAGIR
jgi:hypothetical protein